MLKEVTFPPCAKTLYVCVPLSIDLLIELPFVSAAANTHPPVLHVNGSLLVPAGGMRPLGGWLLRAEDPDSPAENLLVQLLQPPTNGLLVRLQSNGGGGGGGGESTLHRDQTFSLAELRAGAVRFVHSADKPL